MNKSEEITNTVETSVEVKKERKPLINIKDPKKVGIIAFVLMFAFCAMIFGGVATLLVYKNFFNQDDSSNTDGVDLEVVVTEEEEAIINVVEATKDSVVSIAVSELSFSSGEGLVDESSNIGTGFVVDSSGIIVTNQHVVSDETAQYSVVTADGVEYDVVDIQRDDNNDIAVLKIDATDLVALELGDSDEIVVGQTVIAIGTPLGEYAGSVTTGVVSGLNREVTASSDWFGSSSKTYEDVIQTDAAVNPGNSGGPLLNTSGEVIGINFATTSDADNISFALPINTVKSRLEEYRTYGKFIKPYLGVSYQMISSYQALYYNNVVAGALVVRVDSQGPANDAGVKKGDIIIEFDGELVTSSLSAMISQHKVGDQVEIKLWNNGVERSVTVTLEEAE